MTVKKIKSLLAALLLLSLLNSAPALANNQDTPIHPRKILSTGHLIPGLNDENSNLKADIIRLETQIQALEQENLLLRDRRARDWFISGTGVILAGLFIGFLAHKIQNQRKSSW